MKTKTPLIMLILLFLLAACAQGATELKPPEIRYGEDVCAECNMIISDPRFATAYAYEVSPGRYQSVLFDDIGDMLIYAGKNPTHKVEAWYVHDYETKEWTDATTASYLVSSQVETPMAFGIVSFASRDRAEAMAYSLGTEVIDWNTLQEKHKAGQIGAGMAGDAMAAGGPTQGSSDEAMQQPPTGPTLQASFVAPDQTEVLLRVVQPPAMATAGKQPFEVLALRKQATGDETPLDDLTLQITPEMPSMGHGSPGNVNPTPQGNGHYLGTVNFTMAGPWTVTVVARRGEAVLCQVVFEFAVR